MKKDPKKEFDEFVELQREHLKMSDNAKPNWLDILGFKKGRLSKYHVLEELPADQFQHVINAAQSQKGMATYEKNKEEYVNFKRNNYSGKKIKHQ